MIAGAAAVACWVAALLAVTNVLPGARHRAWATRAAGLRGATAVNAPAAGEDAPVPARPARPGRRRAAGRAVTTTVGALAGFVLAGPPGAAAVTGGVVLLGRWRAVSTRRAVALRRQAALPELLDVLGTAMAAGLTIRQAIELSPPAFPAALQPALGAARDLLGRGARTTDALAVLGAAVGPAARPVVAALVAHERDGAPLRPTLQRLADEARHHRRQRAEQAVRRLPVQLSFPLVCCTLGAFVLLTVVPLAAATLQSLAPTVP